jgi:hypothetical protein
MNSYVIPTILLVGLLTCSARVAGSAQTEVIRQDSLAGGLSIEAAWGNEAVGMGYVDWPIRVQVDEAGNAYLFDAVNGRVSVFGERNEHLMGLALPGPETNRFYDVAAARWQIVARIGEQPDGLGRTSLDRVLAPAKELPSMAKVSDS